MRPPSCVEHHEPHERRPESESLASHLVRVKTLSPSSAVLVATKVVEAVLKLHDSGTVHGGLNLGSIFVARSGPEGLVKVIDGRGSVPAPDGGVDVYAVGVILYRCVSGGIPPEAVRTPEVVSRLTGRESMGLDSGASLLDPGLRRIVHRATSYHSNDRYGSARELLADLAAWADEANRLNDLLTSFLGVAVAAPSPSPPVAGPPARTTRRQHSVDAAILATPPPPAPAAGSVALPPGPPMMPARPPAVDEETTEVTVKDYRIAPLYVLE